jgi:hypothetical protein
MGREGGRNVWTIVTAISLESVATVGFIERKLWRAGHKDITLLYFNSVQTVMGQLYLLHFSQSKLPNCILSRFAVAIKCHVFVLTVTLYQLQFPMTSGIEPVTFKLVTHSLWLPHIHRMPACTHIPRDSKSQSGRPSNIAVPTVQSVPSL